MELGASLGPYRIDRELGAGGMGKVYAATGPDGVVALKIVHPHLLEQPGFFKRFLREADIGKSVRHDNVVRTLDCDQLVSGGQANAYLVMEYVQGQTLADLQRELDKVPEELCRHVAREICKGLAAIHDAGVVHRDLKPENVLITSDHVVKVMDLGVARLADEQMRLSQSGAFIGSVEYAAPEQFGGDVDHRCDLHALGLLLYELSSGQHPYRADTFPEVMNRVREDAPRRVGDINPQLSAFFEEVVQTLLAKSVDDRFTDACELLSVLEEGEQSDWWIERAEDLRAAMRRPLRRVRIPRESAVYGRDSDLEKLRGRYEHAKSGDGQVVLIEGEAGIGKSRLVDEFVGRLRAGGEEVNFLFGSYPPSGAATSDGGFSTAYCKHLGDAGSAAYLTDTPALVPAFDALLTGRPPPKDAVGLTKGSIGACFVQVTRRLAVESPTVILIDDLHFAPDDARGLFTALALTTPGHRVLLIGSMRPGVPEEWIANLSRLEHASRMELSRLGPKDLMALLQDTFASADLANQLAGQIARKSDGNPFFAFEIIRGLREGQFITQKDDGTWASTGVIDEIQIPSSVLDLVNARVADLSQAERDLLDVAACWGFEFDPLLVGDVVGLARIPLLKTLSLIERKHQLVRSAGARFTFDHHQIQEALYEGLPELLRESYHAALAESLERRSGAAGCDPEALDGGLCVDLCEQYMSGAQGASATRYLGAALRHLAEGHLPEHVVKLSERALATPGILPNADRAQFLLRLCDALNRLGRRPRQEECARELVRLTDDIGDAALRGRAARALGEVLWRTARPAEAEECIQRALSLARENGDRKSEAIALGSLGNVNHGAGRRSEARRHYEHALAMSRELGLHQSEANLIGNLALICGHDGRLREARSFNECAIELKRELGDVAGEAASLCNLGLVLLELDLARDARSSHERGLDLCRQVGHRDFEISNLANLAKLDAFEGRFPEARTRFEHVVALRREDGNQLHEAIVLANLALVAQEDGDFEKAEQLLLESLAVGETARASRLLVFSRLRLGCLYAAIGDAERTRDSLKLARDLAAQCGRAGIEVLARCHLACLPGGDAADALKAYALHENRALVIERREACYLLFRATGDRAHLAEARRLLDGAVAQLDEDARSVMVTKVRLNREILAAWREEFGEHGDSTDSASPGESPTRAG